ncbi:patatin [Thermosipho melanesiensis]|uniref:Patatin n=2 Tax=Thermosipho melanesiensis TaxID=46541 RepID=A6LMU7_THEM4|nr:patatin-like phospholipase family protein [Thermosipho melanesiensis]ABR31248.1 Patatin [Thermosipho melanesiensis BI429]APT74332.1 patatin [Thermosipho melanesiensis]OOC36272.1 patatin [Thermosipho melanesiensis]OOC37090.1 patatin [Thermosipho melanesiensis]OOC37842.1 patatin [Thermosipho melanesiensis]
MTIGLSLAAGGVKGFSHIATLNFLEENNIKVDIITGSSAGAIVAALYGLYGNSKIVYKKFSNAVEKFFPNLKIYTEKLEKSNLWSIFQRALVPIDEYYKFFKYLFERKKFSDLKYKIGIVTFDTLDGNSLLITEGFLVDAVMASSSVPGVFSPLWIAGTQNTDGGVLSPSPINEAIKLGADFVIASTFERKPKTFPKDQLELMYYIDTWKEIEIEYVDLEKANVVIYYRIPYHWYQFHLYKEIYESSIKFLKERREEFDHRFWW